MILKQKWKNIKVNKYLDEAISQGHNQRIPQKVSSFFFSRNESRSVHTNKQNRKHVIKFVDMKSVEIMSSVVDLMMSWTAIRSFRNIWQWYPQQRCAKTSEYTIDKLPWFFAMSNNNYLQIVHHTHTHNSNFNSFVAACFFPLCWLQFALSLHEHNRSEIQCIS